MEESEILIEIIKNLAKRSLVNGKEYYEEPPVWPFTRLEPRQVRYLLHKEREEVKSKILSVGEALI